MRVFLLSLLLLLSSLPALSAPITFWTSQGGTGHSYELVNGDYYWTAFNNAHDHTFMGVAGHLAAILEPRTTTWLVETFQDIIPNYGAWIGLYMADTYGVPSNQGSYSWWSGLTPELYGIYPNYWHWYDGFDNPNVLGEGNWAVYLMPTGYWHTGINSEYRMTLIEYDVEGPAEVPELFTFLMTGTGLLLMGSLSRRRPNI